MHILGVDFTSRPRPGKPITCAHARLSGGRLQVEAIEQVADFHAFEALLRRPGPWLGGFDFPFSLPRELVLQLSWPLQWRPLMQQVSRLTREAFRECLDHVRQARPFGARYLHRAADLAARASSAMKLHNPPVGLMLYEGAPRLAASGATVYPCAQGDAGRIALEAYPALLARRVVRGSYKSDSRSLQSLRRAEQRDAIMEALARRAGTWLGFDVVLSPGMQRAVRLDGSGDQLDAVLCACAAAWAHQQPRFGCPADVDRLEGWIVGPLPEGPHA